MVECCQTSLKYGRAPPDGLKQRSEMPQRLRDADPPITSVHLPLLLPSFSHFAPYFHLREPTTTHPTASIAASPHRLLAYSAGPAIICDIGFERGATSNPLQVPSTASVEAEMGSQQLRRHRIRQGFMVHAPRTTDVIYWHPTLHPSGGSFWQTLSIAGFEHLLTPQTGSIQTRVALRSIWIAVPS